MPTQTILSSYDSLDICINSASCASCVLQESQCGLAGKGLFRPPSATPALKQGHPPSDWVAVSHSSPGSLCLTSTSQGRISPQGFPDLAQGFVLTPNPCCRCRSPGAGRAARGGGGGGPGSRGSIGSSSLSPGGHSPVQQQEEAPAQPAQPGDCCPHIGDPGRWTGLAQPGTGLAWHSPSGAPGTAAGCPPAYRLCMDRAPVSSGAS